MSTEFERYINKVIIIIIIIKMSQTVIGLSQYVTVKKS